MNANQRRFLNQLKGSNSMELLEGGQTSRSEGINAQINQIVGNPAFKAEVTLVIGVRYFQDGGAGTPLVPAEIVPLAPQQTPVPVYVFGHIDRAANYARARQVLPVGGGFDNLPAAVVSVGDGRGVVTLQPDAPASVGYAVGNIYVNAALAGDLILIYPMIGFVAAAAATTTRAEVLIRCPNVPYTSLLAALGSDLVTLNMIRYVVPGLNPGQLANQITFIKGSLFGKVSTDTLDPQTFITPGTFQAQIADIPITLPIDKNLILATNINFYAVAGWFFTWTLTVSTINKLTQ